MKDQRFIGTGVAIITPFRNNEIDFPAFEQIINYVINGGVNYIVALGSTGETATLNEDEARSVLDFCIEKINQRVPLVAGNFGWNDTKELVKKIKEYNFNGIDSPVLPRKWVPRPACRSCLTTTSHHKKVSSDIMQPWRMSALYR